MSRLRLRWRSRAGGWSVCCRIRSARTLPRAGCSRSLMHLSLNPCRSISSMSRAGAPRQKRAVLSTLPKRDCERFRFCADRAQHSAGPERRKGPSDRASPQRPKDTNRLLDVAFASCRPATFIRPDTTYGNAPAILPKAAPEQTVVVRCRAKPHARTGR